MGKGHVVVVGSGLAGLVASIAAAEEGARVICLTKSPPGLGNCTTVAGGGFTLAVGGWTPTEHRELTLKTGHHLNQADLVEATVQEAPDMARRLKNWGVAFTESRGSIGTGRYAPHALRRGEVITRPLVKWAQDLGVEFIPRTLVTRLFTDQRGISGVEWLDKRDGSYHALAASSVVLATGGAGQAWGRTDNPPGTTGDGFRLACELGLSFRDMEFVQFYPLGVYEPGFTTWMIGLHLADLVPLTDEDGQDLLTPWLEEWGLQDAAHANFVARDRVTVGLGQLYDRGGAAYLNVDRLSPDQWQLSDLKLLARMYPRHRSPGDAPLRVRPLQHYLCGGVVITDQGETELPGLWAVGELSGGMDGANRVGGNALSHCMVMGYRAGKRAAQSTRMITTSPRLRELPTSSEGVVPEEFLKAVRDISDEYLGPIRHAQGLNEAQRALDQMGDQLGPWRVLRPRDLVSAYQAHSAWVVARLVCLGARIRTESRGTHYRSDYPQQDAGWDRTVFLGPSRYGK